MSFIGLKVDQVMWLDITCLLYHWPLTLLLPGQLCEQNSISTEIILKLPNKRINKIKNYMYHLHVIECIYFDQAYDFMAKEIDWQY